MATHLSEIIKQYAHELLTRRETKRLLDSMADSQPKLVEELVPKLLSLGEVQKVVQQLLREQVSVRDLTLILEALVDTAPITKNPVFLVEAVRQALGRSLVRPFLGEDGKLRVVALDAGMEEEVVKMFGAQTAVQLPGLQPSLLRRLVDGLKALLGEHEVDLGDLSYQLKDGGETFEYRGNLKTRQKTGFTTLAARLGQIPGLFEYDLARISK